jgi:hypothetical protein
MKSIQDIDLFKNLAQLEINETYFDFHNDFYCREFRYLNNVLEIVMKNNSNKIVLIRFDHVVITKSDFGEYTFVNDLTVDQIYRGRTEFGNQLIEIDNEGRGYFYLEFDEGQRMEFWSSGIQVVF